MDLGEDKYVTIAMSSPGHLLTKKISTALNGIGTIHSRPHMMNMAPTALLALNTITELMNPL